MSLPFVALCEVGPLLLDALNPAIFLFGVLGAPLYKIQNLTYLSILSVTIIIVYNLIA